VAGVKLHFISAYHRVGGMFDVAMLQKSHCRWRYAVENSKCHYV